MSVQTSTRRAVLGDLARPVVRVGLSGLLGLSVLSAAVVACSSSEPAPSASQDVGQAAVSQGRGQDGERVGQQAARGAVEPGAQARPHAPSAPAQEASEEVRLAPDESQPPLPDGTFTGHFQGEEVAAEVRFVIRDGMVLVAHVEVVGKRRTGLDLRPTVASDARTLRFQARNGSDYMRLTGRFLDDRRAAGKFQGQVDRKRVSGRWYVLRR